MHERKTIRHLYLPELCITLHHVYFDSKQYGRVCASTRNTDFFVYVRPTCSLLCLQCLQIADVVADDTYGLSEIMHANKQTLQSLLHLMRKASLRALDSGLDALAY